MVLLIEIQQFWFIWKHSQEFFFNICPILKDLEWMKKLPRNSVAEMLFLYLLRISAYTNHIK